MTVIYDSDLPHRRKSEPGHWDPDIEMQVSDLLLLLLLLLLSRFSCV